LTDSVGETYSSLLFITVVPAIGPLEIVTSSVPAATAGAPYSQAFSAEGGVPPYSWSLVFRLAPGRFYAQ
jgi:hypothetical protein